MKSHRMPIIVALSTSIIFIVMWGVTHDDYVLYQQTVHGTTRLIAKGPKDLLLAILPLVVFPSLTLTWIIAIIQVYTIEFGDKKILHQAIQREKDATLKASQAEASSANAYNIALTDTKKELSDQFTNIRKRESNADRLMSDAEFMRINTERVKQNSKIEIENMAKRLDTEKKKRIHAWAAAERFKKKYKEVLAQIKVEAP